MARGGIEGVGLYFAALFQSFPLRGFTYAVTLFNPGIQTTN